MDTALQLAPFKDLIKLRCGLTFEGVGEAPLVSGLQTRIAECGAANAPAYLARLQGDEHEFHELVSLLTINETYFYREADQINFLVNSLIPDILARREDALPVRILSAGCSTGEEPYSIAIALREKYGENAAHLFSLAGGDIDQGALEKARIGRYTEFSFRSLAPVLRQRYFTQHDRWASSVSEEVRSQVQFHHLNLLAENYPLALRNFDVIFFRNVSIYFDMPTRRVIQQHLATLLKDDGYLIIGTAETLANDLGVLHLVKRDGLFYFTKLRAGPAVQPPVAAAPAEAHKKIADWISSAKIPAQTVSRPAAPPPPPAFSPAAPLSLDPSTGEALRLILKKDYAAAMAVLSPLLEQQPGAGAALLLKAQILLHRKDYDGSTASAKLALEGAPWSIDALVLLGLAAKWRNQIDDAVKWFKQAIYTRNDCWPAHYYLGELYRAANEVEKARRAYRAAQQLLSAQQSPEEGFSVIRLGLPLGEVRFLCEHQTRQLDNLRAGPAR